MLVLGGPSGKDWRRLRNEIKPDVILGANGTCFEVPDLDFHLVVENMHMAAGRAIVTSDLPVIREVLNEKSAVFCEPDDIRKWKVGIEGLLADESRRVRLGKQALQEVGGYTWLARAEKILGGL